MLVVSPDLLIHSANPAAENLLGRSAKRLRGRDVTEILDFGEPEITRRIKQTEEQLIARGLPLKREDKTVSVNLTISPLQTHTGWRVVTLSDSGQGERFGDEERRVSLRGPAVLAHEIKNPLAAIRGAAQLIARQLDEGKRDLTNLIADEVDRIAQLIDRMQRLGREKAEPVGPLNLHAAIHRACDTVKAASDKPLYLKEEFDPSLPDVLANEGALVQVLINLISNARDACAGRREPQVVIQTRFVSGLVMNVIRLGRPVKLPIEISVSDNGPGIDPSVEEHIFEPFVSSKPHGQGLGLALVQKLVRDMDGRISHERDDSGGWTHFRVHLPMAK
ncbi:PAS domain-containing sensor histidine kinase [Alteraurantiacibacter aquimixticola]|uniref:histidine kinase n=2 Tax=Alteraurantiacibacter aquimixticola TaxID=2489173 RepID=A0A4T3F367_9SPHN|nr:PAS domain-containing sensor histidine kinase [Alteraurantiacibacter aquimixticola]